MDSREGVEAIGTGSCFLFSPCTFGGAVRWKAERSPAIGFVASLNSLVNPCSEETPVHHYSRSCSRWTKSFDWCIPETGGGKMLYQTGGVMTGVGCESRGCSFSWKANTVRQLWPSSHAGGLPGLFFTWLLHIKRKSLHVGKHFREKTFSQFFFADICWVFFNVQMSIMCRRGFSNSRDVGIPPAEGIYHLGEN